MKYKTKLYSLSDLGEKLPVHYIILNGRVSGHEKNSEPSQNSPAGDYDRFEPGMINLRKFLHDKKY